MKMLKREKKKGIALIMALWIMVALLVICSSFVYMMRIELRIAKDYTNGVKARYLAKAGIAHALGELNADNVDAPPNYIKTDSLHETWFTKFSNETWFPFGEGGYQVSLIDEAGMHNINAIEGGLNHYDSFAGMVDLIGDAAKACRIRDYHDADILVVSGSGATGWDTDCKNRPYDTIREIQKVKDINLGGNPLADHTNELTVHSQEYDTTLTGDARLNLNTATEGEIASYLSAAGESDPTGAAAAIYAHAHGTDGPWLIVGQIQQYLSGESTTTKSKTMKRVADKFTVAPYDLVTPAPANDVYYKPDTNPTLILGPININTAPAGSLCSLIWIGPSRAASIIATRTGLLAPDAGRKDDAEQGTVGDPFTYGVADSVNYGRGEIMLTAGGASGVTVGNSFYDHSDQVTVRSDRFRIVSTGKVLKGGEVVAQRKIEVVVDRHYHDQNPTASGIDTGAFHTMGPFEILYWSETVPEFL